MSLFLHILREKCHRIMTQEKSGPKGGPRNLRKSQTSYFIGLKSTGPPSIPLRAALRNALIAMLSGRFFMFKKVVQKWSRLFLMARNA